MAKHHKVRRVKASKEEKIGEEAIGQKKRAKLVMSMINHFAKQISDNGKSPSWDLGEVEKRFVSKERNQFESVRQ